VGAAGIAQAGPALCDGKAAEGKGAGRALQQRSPWRTRRGAVCLAGYATAT